jgi:hypothetical protein
VQPLLCQELLNLEVGLRPCVAICKNIEQFKRGMEIDKWQKGKLVSRVVFLTCDQ